MFNRLLLSTKQLVLLLLLSLESKGFVVLGEEVGVLLVGRLLEHGLLPQVGSQEGVGLRDGGISCLSEVSKSSGGTSSRGVAILDTGHLQQLLGHRGGHNAGTTGSGDQTHPNRTTLASHLGWDGVGFTDLITPESPPDWDNGQLSEDNSSSDGGGHLLAALDSQSDVPVVVADGNKSLEPGPLTGTGLLLDGHNLHDVILERGAQEVVDDLELFDGQREQVDLLQRLDLSVLDQTAELGD